MHVFKENVDSTELHNTEVDIVLYRMDFHLLTVYPEVLC